MYLTYLLVPIDTLIRLLMGTSNLFAKAESAMRKKPKVLITDGLKAYHKAVKGTWWTHRLETRTRHIRHITIQGDRNNNKMERLNREIRDRERSCGD
jgi:transposase-like protein